jgi:hypothetical protein
MGEIKNLGASSTSASRIDSTEEATICSVTEFKPSPYTSEEVSVTTSAFSWFFTKTVPSDLRGEKHADYS